MGDESYGLPVARGLDRPLQPLHHLVHRVAPPLRMSVLGVEPGKIRRYAEETIFQVVNLSHVNKALSFCLFSYMNASRHASLSFRPWGQFRVVVLCFAGSILV